MKTKEEAAREIVRLVEQSWDEEGLSQKQRDKRWRKFRISLFWDRVWLNFYTSKGWLRKKLSS